MIAHPLSRSRASSDRINLLHTAFFLFCFVFHIRATSATSTLFMQITFLPPSSVLGLGTDHVAVAPALSPQGDAAVPVWERRCLLSAVWLGKVRLHSLQM